MSVVETHKAQSPRLFLFQLLIGAMLFVLTAGLAYRQLLHSGDYEERKRLQNQRRVLVPGPRGNIYDRDSHLLVGNRSRFAVTLYLDQLRREFRTEYIKIVRGYRESEAAGDITRTVYSDAIVSDSLTVKSAFDGFHNTKSIGSRL